MRITPFLAAICAALLFAGCGSGDAPRASDAPPASTLAAASTATPEARDDAAEIRTLSVKYVAAVNAGRGDEACKLMTPAAVHTLTVAIAKYRALVGSTERVTCSSGIRELTKLVGKDVIKLSVTTVKVTGDTATAPGAQVDDDGTKTAARFARIDGRWLVDDDTDSGENGETLQQRVKAWPKAWCALKPGATRAAIRKALGPPTALFAEQDQWEGFGTSLDAFYDADLKAYLLQVNSGEVKCDRARRVPIE